jgi:hypothetical protein
MASEAMPWKPPHSEVVKHLCDNLGKLGIKYIDHLLEVRTHIGQDVNHQIDLVTTGDFRARGAMRSNHLTVFVVKSEPSHLFRTVLDALQQVSLCEFALLNPSLYVVGDNKMEKSSNGLVCRQYLVIQRAIWDEQKGLSEDEAEKLRIIIALRSAKIITYASKWRFKLED